MRRPWLGPVLVAGALALGSGVLAQPRAAAHPTPDQRAGEAVFAEWCAPCHARGPGNPGTQSLEIKYGGRVPAALEDRRDLAPQVTTYFVRNGVALMPSFRKTEIGDAELAQLAAYLAPAGEGGR